MGPDWMVQVPAAPEKVMTMVSSLPAEFLDPHTPPEVVVTDQIRPRITDSTLGVPLAAPGPGVPSVPDPPRHALVTVGDSLTHGMSSGAVFHTDLSWPALVARSLGAGLVVPTYRGPLDGLPLNIETLLRDLQGRFGDELNLLEMAQLPFELHGLADANEDYWERGDGSRPPRTDLRYENVGIYGWDVRDCLSSTAARAMARIASHPAHDDLLGAKPDNDNDIAAASVLAPFGSAAAQIDAVASHGYDGGIGTLVVMLGANNALGSVVRKSVVWSGPQFQDLDRKGAYTVWNPTHFQAEYAELVRQLLPIPARRLLLATVPHVTVAPIATGVNPANPGATPPSTSTTTPSRTTSAGRAPTAATGTWSTCAGSWMALPTAATSTMRSPAPHSKPGSRTRCPPPSPASIPAFTARTKPGGSRGACSGWTPSTRLPPDTASSPKPSSTSSAPPA